MARYIVTGGNKLSGEVKISGNKNSVLPCLAACLLTEKKVTLTNVPQIRDVTIMIEILKSLGAVVQEGNETITVSTPKIISIEPSAELLIRLRASVLLAGPLLARAHKVVFAHPGGDMIGKRTIEPHIEGFEALGYQFKRSDTRYEGKGTPYKGTVHHFLEEPSVTGTENLVMAAVLRDGITILRNCASEPHIVDLCKLLNKMGAKITGGGSSTLTIEGVKSLGEAEFRVGQDYMELGTYAVAAAITKGQIYLTNCTLEDMEPLTMPLSKMGVVFEEKDGKVSACGKNLLADPKLQTNIWPGFPTDLMSIGIVLATQAKGITLCHDWMYEGRLFFVDKLISMGAHITIADPHRVLVYGPSELVARDQDTPDIRAGMALLLAALIAKGTSVINRAELIERGYSSVVEKLTSLGAQIERMD